MQNNNAVLTENAFMHQRLQDEAAARAASGQEEPGFLKKAAVVGGVGTGIVGAGAGALYGLGKLAEYATKPLSEGTLTITMDVNKGLLLTEAMDIILEGSVNGPKRPVNKKTGANSTASDTSTDRSASPLFEKAASKTVEDHVDITDENKATAAKNEKIKEDQKVFLRTRMVD